MRQNPPVPTWASKIIRDQWPALVARVPDPSVLPSTAHVGPRGGQQLAEAYGCGHYGCVLPTGRPGVVFKLTSDPSEATFVSTYLSERPDRRPAGIVWYFDVVQLPGKYRGRTVFALWREEATDVGRALDQAMGMSDPYENYARSDALGRLSSFRALGELLRRSMASAKVGPQQFLIDATRELDARWSDLEVDAGGILRGTSSWAPGPEVQRARSWYRGPVFGAWLLRALSVTAEMMSSEPGATLVGEALDHYLDLHIVLADVHAGNVGRVVRGDDGGLQVVITDPGHMIALPGAKISTPHLCAKRACAQTKW
jgi:hypothetical protein